MGGEHAPRHQDDAPLHDGGARVLLFDARGEDREIAIDALDPAHLAEHQIAWIDIVTDDPDALRDTLARWKLDTLPIAPLLDARRAPVFTQDDWWGARALSPAWDDAREIGVGAQWMLIVGPNLVITVHRRRVQFLEALARQDDAGSRIGQLDADSFAAAVLDRMLTAYFDTVDAFEDRLDKLEVDILQKRINTQHLPQLRRLRKSVSVLRRMLSSHRDLFDALVRPDFQPDWDEKVQKQFRALERRYERAVDAVENARDLVIGSYELLSTRLSQRTNETMRLLTFVTVMLGTLAVAAGVLGMNFKAPLFDTGGVGFWIAVGGMVAFVLLALGVARWRGWWR